MSDSSRHIDYAAAAHAAERETIRDRAAEWSDLLRHRGGRPEVREDFKRWCDARPEHAEVFERLDAAHRLARAARETEAMAEIERDTLRRIAARRTRKRLKTFAAAAAVVVAVLAGLAVTEPVRNELNYWSDWAAYAWVGDSLYRTAIGEQRTIELPDGSELTLNTNSRAVVQFETTPPVGAQPVTPPVGAQPVTPPVGAQLAARNRKGTRAVTLLQGQALFEVARDETRPFVVTAGDRKITALGTAFDVRLTEKELEVVLIEGRVKVEEDQGPGPRAQGPARDAKKGPGPRAQGPGRDTERPADASHASRLTPHILQPGQQLIVATADPLSTAAAPPEPVIRQIDAGRATSWHDGQLIFRNDRLADAVAEVNRYSKRKIVLANGALDNLRVSGIVNVGNTAVFVETMVKYYPVKIVDNGRRQVTLAPRRG